MPRQQADRPARRERPAARDERAEVVARRRSASPGTAGRRPRRPRRSGRCGDGRARPPGGSRRGTARGTRDRAASSGASELQGDRPAEAARRSRGRPRPSRPGPAAARSRRRRGSCRRAGSWAEYARRRRAGGRGRGRIGNAAGTQWGRRPMLLGGRTTNLGMSASPGAARVDRRRSVVEKGTVVKTLALRLAALALPIALFIAAAAPRIRF